MWYLVFLAAVASYLLGNLNGAVIASSVIAHDDVRSHGSGNAGLTNFIRNYGAKSAILVIAIDVGKGILACFASGMLLAGYGYYEASIKFPYAPGTWGAFWMMCGNVSGVDGSAADGVEIDIIESIGNDWGACNSALHWDGYGDDHKQVSSGEL